MKRYLKLGVAAAVIAIAAFFLTRSGTTGPRIPTQGPLALTGVKYWAFQMQDVDAEGAVDALAASRYDMLVVEPTRTDCSDASTQNFGTAAMVTKLKNSAAHDGVHRKLAIAYINIGEAEIWRWYWTWSKTQDAKTPKPADWPSFIIEPDPGSGDSSNDYPVAFWDPAWKDIVIYGQNHQPPATPSSNPSPRNYSSLLDEVIKDGFDGVYLDWVEGYEDERVEATARKTGVTPSVEMVKFIGEMRKYARERNPNFLIIQHNGSDLIVDQPEVAKLVDGIGQEGIWFTGETDAGWSDAAGYDQPQDPVDTNETVENLKLYREAGKPVFDVEYAVSKSSQAHKLSLGNGLIPYCSRAALNQLSDTTPPGY